MYKEAIEDGKCYICGEEIKCMNYKRNVKYTCKRCKDITEKVKAQLTIPEKEKKLNNALKRIKLQGNLLVDYSNAIKLVHKSLDKPNYFQSTEEIMVALQLIKDGYKINHQVKVDKYYIDFIIESEKVILEVDGEKFHNELTTEKEKQRDLIILSRMGFDWEIIRIKCKYINENVNALSKYIKACKCERKKYRQAYGGNLPKFYNEYGL